MQCHESNYRIYNQSYFNSIHDSLTLGRTSRPNYVKNIDGLWGYIDPKYHPSLQRRKDKRSLGEFALMVHDNSVRERFLVDEWIQSLGREDVVIQDYGVANNGRLILDSGAGTDKPDYRLFSSKGEWLLEVKFCPVQYKLTFKVCDLKNYARKDALVLLVMGRSDMIGPNGDPHSERKLVVPAGLKWALLDRATIRNMLHCIPIKNHKEMGYKPSIQIRDNQIYNFLKINDW